MMTSSMTMPDGFVPGRHGDDFYVGVIRPPRKGTGASILTYAAWGWVISGVLGAVFSLGQPVLAVAVLISGLGTATLIYAAATVAQAVHDSAYWSRANCELLRRAEERAVTSQPVRARKSAPAAELALT